MAQTFQLAVRSGPNAGKVYSIDKNELFIGRETGNDIIIPDPEVSRRHARVFLQGANYVLEDLGSTNGTSVNSQRLAGPYVLRPGETITLGEHVSLVFEAPIMDPDATMASAAVRPPVAPPPPPVVPQYQQQPRYTPPPPPPPPVAAYNQPPAQQPTYEEPYVPERRFPSWAIILIVLLLFIICVCGVFLYVIDSQNMWCDLFPFLFPACQ